MLLVLKQNQWYPETVQQRKHSGRAPATKHFRMSNRISQKAFELKP